MTPILCPHCDCSESNIEEVGYADTKDARTTWYLCGCCSKTFTVNEPKDPREPL